MIELKFKIECHNFKVFYVILMVTTKKIPIKVTQNKRGKGSKYINNK